MLCYVFCGLLASWRIRYSKESSRNSGVLPFDENLAFTLKFYFWVLDYILWVDNQNLSDRSEYALSLAAMRKENPFAYRKDYTVMKWP